MRYRASLRHSRLPKSSSASRKTLSWWRLSVPRPRQIFQSTRMCRSCSATTWMAAAFHVVAEHDLHNRSEEHTSELHSLMRISYAVFCLKNKNNNRMDGHAHSLYTKKNISRAHLLTPSTHK